MIEVHRHVYALSQQDRQIDSLSELIRPGLTGQIGTDKSAISHDAVKDLPPKSPTSRRLMPTLPTRAKRGEVRAS